MTKIILGAGISGLICNYLWKDSFILTKNIGGKVKTKVGAVIYLHQDRSMDHLLISLGLSTKLRKIKIGYVSEDKLYKELSQESPVREKTVIKKMTDCKHLFEDSKFPLLDTTLSVKEEYINCYEVTSEELSNVLAEKQKNNIFNADIVEINDHNIVCQDKTYAYEKMVSTIPANVFFSLYQGKYLLTPNLFQSLNITSVLCDKYPTKEYEEFDFVYNADYKTKYHRLIKCEQGVIYEFTGRITQEEAESYLPEGINLLDFSIQPMARVFTNPVPDFEHIKFLGRFAQWNHQIKTQQVTRKIMQEITNW